MNLTYAINFCSQTKLISNWFVIFFKYRRLFIVAACSICLYLLNKWCSTTLPLQIGCIFCSFPDKVSLSGMYRYWRYKIQYPVDHSLFTILIQHIHGCSEVYWIIILIETVLKDHFVYVLMQIILIHQWFKILSRLSHFWKNKNIFICLLLRYILKTNNILIKFFKHELSKHLLISNESFHYSYSSTANFIYLFKESYSGNMWIVW